MRGRHPKLSRLTAQTMVPRCGLGVRKGTAGGSCPGGHSTAVRFICLQACSYGTSTAGEGKELCLGLSLLWMCLFLLGRCSMFVSEGIHSFCSSFQCPRTLSNTKVHEYFPWHEGVLPSVSDTGSPARNYLCFCLAGTHSMMETSESSHTEWWQRQLARPRI